MEVAVGKASPSAPAAKARGEVAFRSEGKGEGEGGAGLEQEMQVARRVKRRTLVEMLEQCRRTLELLEESNLGERGGSGAGAEEGEGDEEEEENSSQGSSPCSVDSEAEELNFLLKSRVESPKFLEKLGSIHKSVSQNVSADEGTTWDVVTARDLWDDKHSDVGHGSHEDDEDYVLVKQEDIVDGIACFMAAYLLSLKETKELTPDQLQEALSKTFSVKKKRGKLRKAWDGGKVIYNVASWSATAIGIYQNPALFRVATVAFWTSCNAISKLL